MAVLGGGGGTSNEQGAYPAIFFQESQTWACPVAMEAIVYVIGAGGSGGIVGGSSDQTHNCRGGAAGGCAVSRLTLAAQNYTVTIGSGGEKKESPHYSTGAAGGNSVFSGTGISTMTGNGGAGGAYSNSAQDFTTGGGTATGGTLMNNTGGSGGGTNNASYRCSGGGGVNLYGSNCNGTSNVSNFGMGGTPHGSSQSRTQDAGDYNSYNTGKYGHNRNENLAVSYFSQFMTHQGGEASDFARSGSTFVMAGSKQGPIYNVYNTAYAAFAQNAPFCGGHAILSSAGPSGDVVGVSGGVGAGGGGTVSSSGSVIGGSGGSGLIMIFPNRLG